MKNIYILITLSILFIMQAACSSSSNPEEPELKIETTYGNITIKLYKETPLHRDNFMKLVNEGTYDNVLFHRVIQNFMIQSGDPLSKDSEAGDMIGTGDVGYTIPAEFVYPKYYHKRGALAAARQGDHTNPERASSGCQFYIVQGGVFSNEDLEQLEYERRHRLEMTLMQEKRKEKQDEIKLYRENRDEKSLQALQSAIIDEIQDKLEDESLYKFTEKQRKDYSTIGGTPHLDNEYTVFGEVIKGFDVVEKISKTATGKADRPKEDIRILKIKVL